MCSCSYRRLSLVPMAMALLIILAVLPAAGSFFPNFAFPHSYSFGQYEFPGFSGVGTPSRAVMVSMQDAGKTFEAVKGDTLTVTLLETDPHQAWKLDSTDGVQLLNDIVLESYPAQHKFTLRAVASGPVHFSMVDDRNGKAIDTFNFNLAIKEPQTLQVKRLSLGFDFIPALKWPF